MPRALCRGEKAVDRTTACKDTVKNMKSPSLVGSIIRSPKTIAFVIFVSALSVYWLTALLLGRTTSPPTAYFTDLANAFLHGQTYLANPPATADLTLYNGRWYVPFPPLPALLLLPWVTIVGVSQVNTVLFGVVMGAANVALAFLLTQSLSDHGWTHLRRSDNVWLAVLLGLGSVHWYMSTLGSVWFVSQICTVTFMLLAVWIAVEADAPLLSGTSLALAMLARPDVGLCYPLLVAIGIQRSCDKGFKRDRRQWVRWAASALVPLALSGTLLLAYNLVRFHNALDFGYLHENVAPALAGDLAKYGQFSLHYVPRNLSVMLLAGPVWNASGGQILPTVQGMSIFLTTPALFYVFKALKNSPVVIGAWVAAGLLLIPLVTYYNTGWWQFGYRFSLDFMTPVLVLLAVGAGTRVSWAMRLAIILGVIVNVWGTWWFLNPRFFA